MRYSYQKETKNFLPYISILLYLGLKTLFVSLIGVRSVAHLWSYKSLTSAKKSYRSHKKYYQHCSLPSDNIINDSVEGVLVSPFVICHTRGFYPTPSTIYQNNGKICLWGVTINAATKLLCKYKHNTIQRPGSRWSNTGDSLEIAKF